MHCRLQDPRYLSHIPGRVKCVRRGIPINPTIALFLWNILNQWSTIVEMASILPAAITGGESDRVVSIPQILELAIVSRRRHQEASNCGQVCEIRAGDINNGIRQLVGTVLPRLWRTRSIQLRKLYIINCSSV